jgi:dienelactone hydrolase
MIDPKWTVAAQTREAWEVARQQARAVLWRLLGEMPPMFTPQPAVLETVHEDGYTRHKIAFDNGAGATVYGYLLVPDGDSTPKPAILYNHAHGGKYHIGKDELLQDTLIGCPPGEAFVRQGYVVLAVDAYAFGERQDQGPGGDRETGQTVELSLFKKFVWAGSTLWGMMLRDDLLALNYLLSLPEVDPVRVGTTGMSLGGSRATWLAALDDRLKVVIPVAQMTRYHDYDAQGQYTLHGIYYYLPGALRSGLDMEILASLAAPRPQRIVIGDSDPLSPFAGVQTILDFAARVYQLYGASHHFEADVYAGMGHQYTPEMFAGVIDCFRRYL